MFQRPKAETGKPASLHGKHASTRRWHPGRVRSWLVAVAIGLALVPSGHCAAPDKSGVKPSVLSLPSGAGSIEGLGESFEPQLNTGGSSYGVSVHLPPGRAGLAPSVRVDYNSFSGNGICGIGWSLEFLTVKRQTDKGFPEYEVGDTFMFAGEELVPLNNAGQDWRCENERGFQRLRRIDSDGDGAPDAWEVTERNGTRHTLGRFRGQNNRWSAVENGEKASADPFDRTYCWMLDSTTDLHGNRVEYEYLRGSGVLYPSRITYGHRSNNVHEVTFHYQDRPDVFDDYRPAFRTRLDRRLTRIEVRTQGRLVRAYNFAYAYELGDLLPTEVALQSTYLDLGVTLLKRVVQVDNSGNDANYLPPLIFTYSGLDLTKSELRAFASSPELDLAEPNGRVQLADLDGDALPDLLATTVEGATTVQRVALNRGESRISGQPRLTFASPKLVLGSSPVDLAHANTVIHDPKGKGLVDVSSLVDDGGNKRLETFLNRARLELVDEDRLGFSQEGLESTILANPPVFVNYGRAATRQMDVNFDKRSDFVHLEPSFGGMKVNTFFMQRGGTWVVGESTLPASYPLANTFDGPDGQPNARVHLADMNGDRMLDLVCLTPAPSGAGQRVRVSYWPLRGRGQYGDEQAMLTTGPDSFEIAGADLRDIFLEDITGDGLTDVLILDGSGQETVLTLRVNIAGQRWSPPYTRSGLPRYAPRDAAEPTILRIVDLNANGSLDLLFRNTAPENTWAYFEILPQVGPHLMTGIDNGLGKRTTIVYGSAAEDEQWARATGHPWRTFAPLPLQVVRQIRTTGGVDLNGDGKEDTAVAEFRYRDPYYDGFEREFRGFAFAQRITYGDDFIHDPATGRMGVSSGWNPARTPTGQVSGPSLVTRYRFITGAADQQDNDDYGGAQPAGRLFDEITEIGGREEEVLKGRQWIEEQVDPVVLHSAPDGGFDAGCEAATLATTPEGQGKLTPDAYVYSRVHQEWTVRRLYRPSEPLPYIADQDGDGVFEDYRNTPVAPFPPGRFSNQGISVLVGNGRSVSFAFAGEQITEVRDANGLLSATLGYAPVPVARTRTTLDYDDYGNLIVVRELGLEDPAFDDERIITTTYAHGGNALSLWIVDRPDTINVTDEKGAFVARTEHFYDGDPFVGAQGQIQSRALLHRTLEYIDSSRSIPATRSRFDAFGNIEETRDPVGNIRRLTYDAAFNLYPVAETMVVGGGYPDLVMEVEYDFGFGVVTRARDFNGNVTTYHYDSFARPVKAVRPGDTVDLPTITYEYQPCDPVRGRAFNYDLTGKLSLAAVPLGSVSRVATRQREKAGQPGEYLTASYSDGGGRPLAAIEEGEVSGTWIVKQSSSFNLRGQPQSHWLPFRIASAGIPQFPALWPAGRPPEMDGTNPVVATDTYYDPLGRALRTVAPPETWGGERRETATHHLPFQVWTFDEEDTHAGSPRAGTPHIAYSDGLGRLRAVAEVVRLDDQGRPTTDTNHWVTRYAYDLNDRLIRITDSQNNVKTLQYDGLQRKTFMNDPDQGVTTYVYDDASNLIETTDAKGQRVTYTYDGLNRIRTEEYHDENSPEFSYQRTPDVTYVYDQPAGPVDQGDGTRVMARNTKGLLAYVLDASGEEHTSYDERGRVEWTVKRIPDPGSALPLTSLPAALVSYATRFDYDSMDRVTRLRYPDNDEVGYEYNDRSLLQRLIGGPGGSIISSIDYVASGQPRRMEYGNGVRTTQSYDPRLRLTDLQTVANPGATGQELIHLHYHFDGVSNLQSIEDRRPSATLPLTDPRRNTQAFTYDDLYRLTRVQYNAPALSSANGGQINYRYDRLGNLLAQSSDRVHLERGLPVTDLGVMSYGGASGPANRPGRQPDDPPGPHALTSIAPSPLASRNYSYDANGNMTAIDGLRCTWDFKDRLVEVEDETMRTEYRYDYTDRRIIKRVWPKSTSNPSPAASDPAPSTVLYPDQRFEVREHDEPTKYVFSGATRVARVTGSLSTNTRIQRLRVGPGWNLLSLAVTAPDALHQITNSLSSPLPAPSLLQWDSQSRDWLPVLPNEALPAGTVLWLHAATHSTLVLTGVYHDPTNRLVPVGQFFCPSAGLEAWDIRSAFDSPDWRAVWHFPGREQHWDLRSFLVPDSDSTVPEFLPPGSALFVSASTAAELEVPEASLRIRYYHQDHLGSSSVITDAEGTLVEEAAYYPFGEVRHNERNRERREAYQFIQKERDRESRLQYFETRYLAGTLSRFISIDRKYANPDLLSPADFTKYLTRPPTLNLYAYGYHNPLVYVDPDGRDNAFALGIEAEGSLFGAASVEAGPAVFTPDAREFYKVWKYDVGLCFTVGGGVGTPGASVTANMSYNPGGRSSFEGSSRTTSISVGEGIVGTGSYSQTSGESTYSAGVGFGFEGGPAVGVTHKQSYTKCFTVGDAVSGVVSLFSGSVKSVAPPVLDFPSSREELSIRSTWSAREDPPPPPRPQPKHAPPPPRRQPRAPLRMRDGRRPTASK